MSPKQCYIRVSVGLPSGCSPGIPYVMEIWPPGHFSPIHNHGNSFGIVRMLHGSITSEHRQPFSFYPALSMVQWVHLQSAAVSPFQCFSPVRRMPLKGLE